MPDEKLQTLAEFVTSMFETRGRPGDADVERFLAAGLSARVLSLARRDRSGRLSARP